MDKMIYKQRTKPYELLVLEFLNNRMKLSKEWLDKLANRQRGYLGELGLDTLTANLGDNFVVVNDVRLPTQDKSTHFQMDTLLITANKATIYEVKNHRGAYYMENGNFFTIGGFEVRDPSYQIKRAGTCLRQHLQATGMRFEVETQLVFIDPTYMLYQAPKDFTFLLHGHLKSHFQSLQQNQQPYRPQQKHLAQFVTENHLFRIKEEDVPDYEYHDLQKGIACASCGSLQTFMQDYSCICRKCLYREKTSVAIRRSIEEFRLLFPYRKITTPEIYKWCRSPSSHQIARVLRKYYAHQGKTRGAYYH